MPTGDPQCPYCGQFFCFYGECLMTMRSKEGGLPLKKFEFEDLPEPQVASNEELLALHRITQEPTQNDLFAMISTYMRDPVFARRFTDCIHMLRSKNADYSQGEQAGDRIAAFRRIARDINIPMKKAWAVFAQKHWGAVMKFVKDDTLESEPIDGRINDLINYFVLLGAIISDERKQK